MKFLGPEKLAGALREASASEGDFEASRPTGRPVAMLSGMRLELSQGQVGVSVEFDEPGRWEHPHFRIAVQRDDLDTDVRA